MATPLYPGPSALALPTPSIVPLLRCLRAQRGSREDKGPSQLPHSPTQSLVGPPAALLLPHLLAWRLAVPVGAAVCPQVHLFSGCPLCVLPMSDLLGMFSPRWSGMLQPHC